MVFEKPLICFVSIPPSVMQRGSKHVGGFRRFGSPSGIQSRIQTSFHLRSPIVSTSIVRA